MAVRLGHVGSMRMAWDTRWLCRLLMDGLVMERRLPHTDVVIVCSWQSVLWYPRGGGSLSVSARISSRRRLIPSAVAALEVAAVIEDSN